MHFVNIPESHIKPAKRTILNNLSRKVGSISNAANKIGLKLYRDVLDKIREAWTKSGMTYPRYSVYFLASCYGLWLPDGIMPDENTQLITFSYSAFYSPFPYDTLGISYANDPFLS